MATSNDRYMIVPLEDSVLFPRTRTKIQLDRETGERIKARRDRGATQALALTEVPGHHGTGAERVYHIGNLVQIDELHPSDDGFIADIRALAKARIKDVEEAGDVMFASFDELVEENDLDTKSRDEMLAFIRETIGDIGKNFQGARPMIRQLTEMEDIETIIANAIPFIPVSVAEKQELMEMDSLRERSLRFIDILLKQKDSIALRIEMAKKFSERTNKIYRENLLREQMKAIQEELGETTGAAAKDASYRERIEASDMPEEVRRIAVEEADKLESMGKTNPESAMVRNYLDLLLALPWTTKLAEEIDIDKARAVLEANHYGLDEVKDRIIQHLAVMKLKKEKR